MVDMVRCHSLVKWGRKMGSDNIFHKRRAKNTLEFRRNNKKRAPMKKVLIVCEGEKTEPEYFNDLINFYKLHTASVIDVTGDCGSSPKSVVEYAFQKFKEKQKLGIPYDEVYCVFDKDAHQCYDNALKRIKNLRPEGTFFSITSVPCFELWLLLHFRCSTKSYAAQKNNSAGNQVLNDLKRHMPEYKKKDKKVFTELIEKLDTAFENARKINLSAVKSMTDNPSTGIDYLVKSLIKIREDFNIPHKK